MRRSLLIGTAMIATLLLAFALTRTPGASAAAQEAPLAQSTPTVTATPAGLPDTGEEGGANIALLAVLGAFALSVAGAALLSGGRKSEA